MGCPHPNPQLLNRFYTYFRNGKKWYRTYCKTCYILVYSKSNPQKRENQKTKIESMRQEEIARHVEEAGFIPRKYRLPPPGIPADQFWCFFCEESHPDDPKHSGSSRCPEYRSYILHQWRRNPLNRRKGRKYLRIWRLKQKIITCLRNNGLHADVKFDYRMNAFLLEVTLLPRRLIRIPTQSPC